MSSHLHDPPEADPNRSGSAPADPYKGRAIGVALLFTLTLPTILAIDASMTPPAPALPFAKEAAELDVKAWRLVRGQELFRTACASCHGQDGAGVPRLGKPLRNSEFVQTHTNEQLMALVASGRPPSDPENTTGAMMPARGAQGLRDEAIHNVVLYLRTMQDPDAPTVDADQWISDAPKAVAKADGDDAAAGDDLESKQAARAADSVGHDLFISSCSACHGAAGEGMEGLGKPLDASPFIDEKTDEELVSFIKRGRPIWDPKNTTGLDMPAKGGNPALSDEQLQEIVDYLRLLHDQ